MSCHTIRAKSHTQENIFWTCLKWVLWGVCSVSERRAKWQLKGQSFWWVPNTTAELLRLLPWKITFCRFLWCFCWRKGHNTVGFLWDCRHECSCLRWPCKPSILHLLIGPFRSMSQYWDSTKSLFKFQAFRDRAIFSFCLPCKKFEGRLTRGVFGLRRKIFHKCRLRLRFVLQLLLWLPTDHYSFRN